MKQLLPSAVVAFTVALFLFLSRASGAPLNAGYLIQESFTNGLAPSGWLSTTTGGGIGWSWTFPCPEVSDGHCMTAHAHANQTTVITSATWAWESTGGYVEMSVDTDADWSGYHNWWRLGSTLGYTDWLTLPFRDSQVITWTITSTMAMSWWAEIELHGGDGAAGAHMEMDDFEVWGNDAPTPTPTPTDTPTATATATATPSPTPTPRMFNYEAGWQIQGIKATGLQFYGSVDAIELWIERPEGPYDLIVYEGSEARAWVPMNAVGMEHIGIVGPFTDPFVQAINAAATPIAVTASMGVVHAEIGVITTTDVYLVPITRPARPYYDSADLLGSFGLGSGGFLWSTYMAGWGYDNWLSLAVPAGSSWAVFTLQCYGMDVHVEYNGSEEYLLCGGAPVPFSLTGELPDGVVVNLHSKAGWLGVVRVDVGEPTTPTPTPIATATPYWYWQGTPTATPWYNNIPTRTPTPGSETGPGVGTPSPVGTPRVFSWDPGVFPTPGGSAYDSWDDVVEVTTSRACFDWLVPLRSSLPRGNFFDAIPEGYTICVTTVDALGLVGVDFMPGLAAMGALSLLAVGIKILRER